MAVSKLGLTYVDVEEKNYFIHSCCNGGGLRLQGACDGNKTTVFTKLLGLQAQSDAPRVILPTKLT
jgi:hypothetical protein